MGSEKKESTHVLDVAHYIQGSQSIYLRLRKPLFTWKTFDLIDDFPWFFIMWEIEESFFSFCASCIVSKLENYSRFTRPKYACHTSSAGPALEIFTFSSNKVASLCWSDGLWSYSIRSEIWMFICTPVHLHEKMSIDIVFFRVLILLVWSEWSEMN